MSDAGPAFIMPTVAKQADGSYRQVAEATDAPIVTASKPDNKPTLSADEIAKLDPERIDYGKFLAFSPMIAQRTKIDTYVNPRENERPVDPIRTREQLGSLVDGARDMPTESVKTILGTDKITAANLADFLDRLTDVDAYPQIVSWRTIAKKDEKGDFVKGPDGKIVFEPIFERDSTKAQPGMEAAAKKIVDDVTRQRTNLVTGRIRAGQVDAATLERWAKGIDAAARMMAPEIVGRETLRRMAINGVIGIDFSAQAYAKDGDESLVGSAKEDPKSGRKVYVPSHVSRRLLSSGVEFARLLQAEKPGTEYYSRVRIGTDDRSLKMGDLGRGYSTFPQSSVNEFLHQK